MIIDGENMYFCVKGVDMEVTPVMWTVITELKYSSPHVGKGNTSAMEDFNKMQYYVSFLRNPLMKVKGFHVGALKLDERVITFIITDANSKGEKSCCSY